MKTTKIITIIITSLILLSNCNSIKNNLISTNSNVYIPTNFPKDTTQLWLSDNYKERDTVLIVGEGGPKISLEYENTGKIHWEYLNNFGNYQTIVMQQSTTYNKSIFNAENFKIYDAIVEINNTSEMLYRAIKYYKDRNKYVVVIGHSYSAYVIQNHLVKNGNLANKYIISSGRIVADSLRLTYQKKGINLGYEKDGKTLILPDEGEKPKKHKRPNRYYTIRKNKELIKYAFSKIKYKEKLANNNLSNLIYFYGKNDQNVGTLTNDEINFLKSKNVKVFGEESTHYTLWYKMVDALNDGIIKF